MNPCIEIHRIFPHIPWMRKKAEKLLEDCGLDPQLPTVYLGVFDCKGDLMAGAGLEGNVVKCVAVREDARGKTVLNSLFSRVIQMARENGQRNIFVFTKPENRSLFESLAMHYIGGGDRAILLESDPRGISSYCNTLRSIASGLPEGRRGVIVMNCNPLTIGHRYLIGKAASETDHLFVIPVLEDRSEFPLSQRMEMIRRCCSEFDNVTVCPGSDYIISNATFPTYFIKEKSKVSEAHIALDCDIFQRHIVPALGVTVRFAGTEHADQLTRSYNEGMRNHLHIEVREIERLKIGETFVSASHLRRCIGNPGLGNPLHLAHRASMPYVLARMGRQALIDELETTPKPGLVDLADNGAHKDMDATIMRQGIESLTPFFARLAEAGFEGKPANEARRIGIEAEKKMFEATGGVNTHRGALFCLGMTIYAASVCLADKDSVDEHDLKDRISSAAGDFEEQQGTHGDETRRKGCGRGALAMAKEGYGELFSEWLPAYRGMRTDPYSRHRLLLQIMSSLEDSNVVYRGGVETLGFVREKARMLSSAFNADELRSLNETFIERNISPGGSADMLALTLLIDAITNKKTPRF